MTESCFFGHKYVFSVIIRWIYGKSPAPSGFALSLFCCIIKRNTDNPSIPRNRSGAFPEDRTGETDDAELDTMRGHGFPQGRDR